MRIRSSASTISSARRRCRTSWPSASPTDCSSRLWNRDRIDHVQITVAETVGVEGRGKFYEVTGALRDMVPNHVFTLLAMVAMEPPVGFDARSIRNKKGEVFAADTGCAARECGARPIWAGQGARRGQEGLSRRAERREGFECRNLCRDEARDRQLALGRRALLSADRQEHGEPFHRDRHPLQGGAARALRGHARSGARRRTGW